MSEEAPTAPVLPSPKIRGAVEVCARLWPIPPMDKYPHLEVEEKWQLRWQEIGAHRTRLDLAERKKYVLVMFSYPSGDKLHIGHWYNYGPTDTYARYLRCRGHNVFEPMGFDAFGLPAENYAIKTGVHPARSTRSNIAFIRGQLRRIGAMYDWSAEVDTSEPGYYRWTQWVFLRLHERGLVYRRRAPVNWCPVCKTVLANDQVIDERCWRCDSEVVRRDLEQWFVRITAYAERLLAGLERLDWPEATLATQRNWIGKSEGARIEFPLVDGQGAVEVFTTRPDTLFGATYLVLAPEHPGLAGLTRSDRREVVERYVAEARRASETERTFANRDKTGVDTGARARHPLSGESLPVWVADYVLPSYGTGAIMAVPAHDQRDHEFASRYDLPVRPVIRDRDGGDDERLPRTEPGVLVRSGEFDGMSSEAGGRAVVERLERDGLGRRAVTYRMHDWCVSRQRYWGAPIPMIHCPACGWVPVPERELPVVLPDDVDFQLSGSGESPLAQVESFVNARCPRCAGPARRETDTMDTFVDSSWYYLRYLAAGRDDVAFDPEVVNRWLPVDMYVGGPEHARGHLIFARFVNMVLHDLGHVKYEEPMSALRHQGIITHCGSRMSKGKGNVVIPDEYIREFGADTFRMYLMFMGSYEQGGDWSDQGLYGMQRFVNRIWRLVGAAAAGEQAGEEAEDAEADRRSPGAAAAALRYRLHASIDAVGRDLERMSFNTAISRIMELTTEIARYRRRDPGTRDASLERQAVENLVQLLAPFAPHLGEELWERLGKTRSVFDSGWPEADAAALARARVTIVVQVDGRLRSRIEVAAEIDGPAVEAAARADEKVREALRGRAVTRVVLVPNKLVNLVTEPGAA